MLKKLVWAPKSLLIGALAGGLDMAIGTFCAVVLQLPTRVCTTLGLIVGVTINFLAQRHFAFRDRDTRLAQSTVRWLIVTTLQILLHGQLVTIFRDQLHVPYVPAKMLGDVLVFTVLQLLLLRYVIFPERKGEGPAADPNAPKDVVGAGADEARPAAAANLPPVRAHAHGD